MEGGSPGNDSVDSGAKKSSVSSSGRSRNCKEFLRRFLDSDILTANLEDWFREKIESNKTSAFDAPFELIDLQKFDYALEGASFQQLIRMPTAVHESEGSAVEATSYLALEDFLHAGAKGLWEAFWSQDGPMPFYVACCFDADLKFYQAEKAIANGKLGGLCATAILLKNPRHPHGRWEDILEIALLRPDVGRLALEEDPTSLSSVVGEAIFFAIRVLLSRSISRSNIPRSSSVFVLVVGSEYGGVVKIEGDVNRMECDVNNVYGCAAEWIRRYSQVAVCPIDKIWNKLGNANWGDIGALQVLYATFHCIANCYGMPTLSIEDLAADHSIRLQARRSERHQGEMRANGIGTGTGTGTGLFRLRKQIASPEIVEVQEETVQVKSVKLEVGSVLWLEDSKSRKGYQIKEVLGDGEIPYYIAFPVDDPTNFFFLYVGSHPSQLEQAWEDMKLWYQVQRQVKVLTVMRQKGVSDKHLPQLSASGKIVHSGQCRQPTSGGNCNRPFCGTSVLVTSPVGKTVADMVRDGEFSTDEAIRCCHDCLSALSTAASAGIRHGDIRPENIIYVRSGLGNPYFVLVGWGHAVLEERDRPAMNLHYSSTYALQEGKLCCASDAESLVYLLYFSISGDFPDLDSVEGALQWREKSWSKRLIQQKLGEISAVLKAFSDYVDSLCGTPYPMDFGIWLRRLTRHIRDESGTGPSC